MLADLLKLLGETPGKTVQGTRKVIILKLKTKLRLQGKVVWVYTCRGHQKVTTDPEFITRGRSIQELGNIFEVFRVVEKEDDGRMTAWLKACWHDAKNLTKLCRGDLRHLREIERSLNSSNSRTATPRRQHSQTTRHQLHSNQI